MKIKANNANSPIWKDVYSHSMLPEQLQPLYEMATNLWWVWNHEGAKLFGKIDSELWASTEGNPVLLLQSLSYKRIEEILADDVLMAEIKAVYSIFKDYVNVKPDQTKPSVAYFSMEYGLTNVLKIYSGGLVPFLIICTLECEHSVTRSPRWKMASSQPASIAFSFAITAGRRLIVLILQ